MNFAAPVAIALGLAALLGAMRLLWRVRNTVANERPRAWRIAALIVLSFASAALLYCVLFPPSVRSEGGTLVVMTADAARARSAALPPGDHVVALPEAPASGDAERVPDLATALRRYPATRRIRVLGAGLVPRDQDAARGHALDFRAAPLPRGLVALWSPQRIQAGRVFAVDGRANELRGGSAELLDPAGAIVDRATFDANGNFHLQGTARSAGLATWRLRLRAAGKAMVDEADVPLIIDPGAASRVLVLAGAPNAELKYLRRWIDDAGLKADAQISLGAGMRIGDQTVSFDAARLGKYDLVVLDQRAWQGLGDARRAALDQAVRGGLGMLLRLSDPLSADERARLRQLGFTATADGTTTETRLPDGFARPAFAQRASARQRKDETAESLPPLTRAPLRLAAADGATLLRDADGKALAAWRARGNGRVGVATFGDSYRLVLAGREDAHGELWSALFGKLARAQATPGIAMPADGRTGQRMTLCGLGRDARIDAPGGGSVALQVDPATGADACAGFWPRQPGWHVLHAAAPAQAGGERRVAFHVIGTDASPGLQAAAIREATLRLASASTSTGIAAARLPGPRWPWFLVWLLVAGLSWWLERARIGTRRPDAAMSGATIAKQ